jgi:hypothetical protein
MVRIPAAAPKRPSTNVGTLSNRLPIATAGIPANIHPIAKTGTLQKKYRTEAEASLKWTPKAIVETNQTIPKASKDAVTRRKRDMSGIARAG